jgi:hypothetical protein
MTSADVTRRTCSLGARDLYTGLCSKVFVETTVKAIIRPKGASYGVIYAKYNNTMFTKAPFYADDEVIHAGKYYHIDTVEEEWRLNVFEFYQCSLTLMEPHVDRPATSGVWHTDSEAITTDVALRQKHWIEEYIVAPGAMAVMLGEPDYQLKREFVDNDLDGIAFISAADGKPVSGIDKKPYAFEESAVINLRCTDKAAITGRNLIEKFEQAIKHVATDHPLGSVRQLTVVRHPEPDDKGGIRIYRTEIQLRYKRANDDYTPTTPSLTYSTIAGGPYTFIFPNVTNITLPNINNDVYLLMPSRLGNYPQALGSESMELQLTCDLDMEPHDLTWLRPQTATPKTDAVNFQVFLDIMHSAAQTEPYMILTLDWGWFNVRLTKMEPGYDGNANTITLTFKEYNDTEADTNYKTRWGIP